MACNQILLEFWRNANINSFCLETLPKSVYYITGATFAINETLFSTPACDTAHIAPTGYYVYDDGTSRIYGYVQTTALGDGIISFTGQCLDCVYGTVYTKGTYYSYYDCCGNLIQGTANADIVTLTGINVRMPYSVSIQIAFPTSPLVISCVTPTPTPTTTITPTVTPTVSITPTLTSSPTPTPSFTPEPTPEPPIHYPYNSCDTYVSFPMGISCAGTNPTTYGASDGTVRVNVTGGTTPYKYYWATGQRTQTINNQPAGIYIVTVVDYYGDYTATTTCTLVEGKPSCELTGTATQI